VSTHAIPRTTSTPDSPVDRTQERYQLKNRTSIGFRRISDCVVIKFDGACGTMGDAMDGNRSPLLELRNLEVRRGRRVVLAGVSLAVGIGERWAVIGPNGAGKTTLLEAVVGQQAASSGVLEARGSPLHGLAERARLLAWVAADARPTPEARVDLIVREAARRGRADAARRALFVERLALGRLLQVRAGELSRGEQHRLALAEALLLGRPLVVLDEPLGAYDPLQLREVLALLRDESARGVALLVSVHQLSDAEKFADRVLVLHEGRALASGSLGELQARAGRPGGSLEDVFLALLAGGADAA
jgi:ABC-2 type transport system ATP-binding protein